MLGAPPDDVLALPPNRLTGQPGTRALHLMVNLEGRTISTLDLYGRGFVLLAGADGAGWVAAAERTRRRLDVPLAAYRFGVELLSADGAAAHGLGPGGALLVRPDGFVAWQVETNTAQPERLLEDALTTVLARPPARRDHV